MRMSITPTDNVNDYRRVSPDFIYNRFDLHGGDDFYAVRLGGSRGKVIEYRATGERAELGLWLTEITVDELEQLILYIVRTHSSVRQITFSNGMIPYATAKVHNHFRIVFPETVEEMESRVSAKSRSKARKKLRFAEEAYGEARITEYEGSGIPDSVVEEFFRFKLATRGREYNMTPAEYLSRYHVSHCYVLTVGETVGAVRFACEQCPVVYGENFAFNPELSDYSLGRYIFMYHLNRMVEKGHTQLFFAGGDFEYKTHYGSVEETVYDCRVDVEKLDIKALEAKYSTAKKLKRKIASMLPKRLGDWLYRIKVRILG